MQRDSSNFEELTPSALLDEVRPGQVLGRYELILPVAKGGMAMVWAARLRGTRGFQKMVAIKTMLPAMIDEPKFEKMFLDEAALASGVHHPNVIEILDLGEQDHVLYLVMEWVDGEPLNIVMRYAEPQGGIPLPIAVHLVCQACKGLHAAHELRDEEGRPVGLVHRDVSPQNVLVTYAGVVKVVDFGVARATARTSPETEDGHLRGKIAYMSPEQLRGDPIDRRTDVFALGILLYMLTTGQHPFRGDDQAATIRSISSDREVRAPSTFVPAYPLRLEAIVLRALEKDPARRHPTAKDLFKALSEALPDRAATDEDVAAFMRQILPDRLEKRRRTMREALRSADRTSEPPPLESSPHAEAAPLDFPRSGSNLQDFLSAPQVSPLPTLPERLAPKSDDDGSEASTGISDTPPTEKRWLVRAAMIAVLACATGALAIVLLRDSDAPDGRMQTNGEDGSYVLGRADDRTSDTALNDAGVPGRGADGGGGSEGETSSDPSRPARKPPRARKAGSGDFVSPIRDPGF